MGKPGESFAKRKIFSTMTLLVISLVLIVAATLAWIILSAAPEVVGIKTTVTANGSLEIALLDNATDRNPGLIGNPVGASLSVASSREANVTWGNLVDLTDETYGLDHIVLRPGQLNLIDAEALNSTVLRTAEYGADGRLSGLTANTMLASFTENSAFDGDVVGVRAVGIDTGMSSRQAAFTSFLSEGDNDLALASSAASAAMNAGGATLAELSLVAYFGGGGGDAPVSGEQVSALRATYRFLHNEGGTGALDCARRALLSYARAYVLSSAGDADDAAAAALASSITSVDALSLLPLPTAFSRAAALLEEGLAAVSAGLAGLPPEEDTTFAQLEANGSFRTLCDPEHTLLRAGDGSLIPLGTASSTDIFGLEIDPENLSGEAVNAILELYRSGLQIVLDGDCGLLGMTAELVGRYGAADLTLDATPLMERTIGLSSSTLAELAREFPFSIYADPQTSGAVAQSKAGVYTLIPAGNGTTAVSETYGYQLDFALRTNVEGASLYLQTDAADRIYSDGAGATLGGGSYLQFTGVRQRDIDAGKICQIMSAIRVAFVAPMDTGYAVYGIGALDMDDAVISTTTYTDDTVKAPLSLYHYSLRGRSLTLENRMSIGLLTDLAVNTVKKLSVIVYLDGDYVDNSMAAHASTLSMEGALNLQFSTNVDLIPSDDPLLRLSTSGEGSAASSGGSSLLFGLPAPDFPGYLSSGGDGSHVVASGACGEELFWTFDLAGLLRISGSGDMWDYAPGTAPWAAFRTNVRAVALSEGVTGVGNYAFSGCEGLESLSLSAGLERIGDYAFCQCSGLPSVTLPAGLEAIGPGAFSGCAGLTEVTVPAEVTSIGPGAFARCTGLSEIGLAPGNTAYTVAEGVLFTADGRTLAAFPAGRSESEYAVPAGVTAIEDDAFCYSVGLRSLTLPAGLESIGHAAFLGCSSLSELSLPESLQSIRDLAFYGCTGLTEITLPAGVGTVGAGAFSNCLRLPEIGISPENIAYRAVNGVLFTTDMKTLLCYPAGKSGTEYEVPESVTEIPAYAFAGGGRLEVITLPEGLQAIGESAFETCRSLAGITVPAGVERLGERAFQGCTALTGAVLPEGITDIGGYTFSGCRALTGLEIPAGVERLGESAFQGCTALGWLRLPESLRSIGDAAFDYTPASRVQVNYAGIRARWREVSIGGSNGALTSASIHCADDDISLGDGTCGEGLFWTLDVDGCLRVFGSGEMEDYSSGAATPWADERSSIREVALSYGVKNVGDHAFQNCTGLSAVSIPLSVERVGASAFQNCTGLTAVAIPESVEALGASAFVGCTALTEITLPASLTEIGNAAFDYVPGGPVTVRFGGTKARWEAVALGENNGALAGAVIRCTDGELP